MAIALLRRSPCKSVTRYRYYVSQLAIKNPGGQCTGPIRIPAHEVERQVAESSSPF